MDWHHCSPGTSVPPLAATPPSPPRSPTLPPRTIIRPVAHDFSIGPTHTRGRPRRGVGVPGKQVPDRRQVRLAGHEVCRSSTYGIRIFGLVRLGQLLGERRLGLQSGR